MKQACESVKALIALLSEEEKTRTCLEDIESDDFRLWSNPELYVNPGGLRLDEVSKDKQEAVHKVLKASLSESGYKKVRVCPSLAGLSHTRESDARVHVDEWFLGAIGGSHFNSLCTSADRFCRFTAKKCSMSIHTTFGYLASQARRLHGEPDCQPFGFRTQAYYRGWTLFGHHLCLAVAFVGSRSTLPCCSIDLALMLPFSGHWTDIHGR